MIPQIFQLGPLPINSFGLTIALAIIAGIICLQKSFSNNGIDPKLAEKYTIAGGLIGLLGARLWYMFIEDFSRVKQDLAGAFFSSAGFTFHGGFIIAFLALVIMSRLDKLPLSKFLDSFGPTLTLGYLIGRLGCQLSGDGDYGISTSSFLGMSFSQGVVPTPPGVLVFPTPFYESFLAGLVLVILLKAEVSPKWQLKPLSRFGLCLVLLGLERFFVEFLRINPELLGIFSEAQIIASGMMLAGLILIFLGTKILQRRIIVS